MLDVIAIPALRDNYIWLVRHEGSAIVIDPGDAEPVIDFLNRERLALAAILVTHHHADHQGGIAALVAREGAEVYGPATESITGLSRPLSGGESIRVGPLRQSFEVLHVPGHTLGHLAYFSEDVLFCGDTLFGAGCGRLFEGTPEQMFVSLSHLAALPDATRVFPAHEYTQSNLQFARAVEPRNQEIQCRIKQVDDLRARGLPTLPTTIGVEKATNPFLRCAAPEVIEAARTRSGGTGSPVEVFAAIREWKNIF